MGDTKDGVTGHLKEKAGPSLGLAVGAGVFTYKVARRIPTLERSRANESPA